MITEISKTEPLTFKLSSENSYPLLTITPTYNVVFYSGSVQVGKLDWNDGVMKFTGDADESAKLFFDNIIKRYEYTK